MDAASPRLTPSCSSNSNVAERAAVWGRVGPGRHLGVEFRLGALETAVGDAEVPGDSE